jgi:hypothetical protein
MASRWALPWALTTQDWSCVKDTDSLSKEQLRQLLLRVLDGLADELGLPKQAAPNQGSDREAAEDEPLN